MTDTEGQQSDGSDAQHSQRGVRRFVPEFVRRSLALKLGIALLLMGVTVGIAGGYGTMQIQSEFKQDVNQQYASIAEREAGDIMRWNQRNVDFVEFVARSGGVQQNNATRAQQQFTSGYATQLEQYTRDTTQTAGLHYVDTGDAGVLASTDWQRVGRNVSTFESAVRTALNTNETRVTVPYNSTNRVGETVARVAYVTPVPHQADQYVVFTVPLDAYRSGLAGEDNGYVAVVGAQDRIIMSEQGDNLLSSYPEANGVPADARALNDSAAGVRTAGPATGLVASTASESLIDESYVVAYSRVPETNWSVLTHANKQQVYGPVVNAANRGFTATVVGVLALVVVGALVGRSLTGSINGLTRKTTEMQQGNLDVEFPTKRVDAIGDLYVGFADMRDALREQISEAEQARKEAEVSRAEAMEMNEYLQERADVFSTAMEQAAAGDLTRRLDADGENEAMDRIAAEFNEMIDELERTLGQLKTFADEVETASDVVQGSSESVRDASEQVAASVQKISDDAYEQKSQLQAMTERMDAIATDIEALADREDVDLGADRGRIDEVATMLNEIVDLSEATMAEAETVAGAAEEQAAELNEVSQRAEDLSRYARPLRQVLDRFETETEREFFFPSGPGSEEQPQPPQDD